MAVKKRSEYRTLQNLENLGGQVLGILFSGRYWHVQQDCAKKEENGDDMLSVAMKPIFPATISKSTVKR